MSLRSQRRWLTGLPVLAALAIGCGSSSGNPGEIPESKDPQATRAFIENPGGVKERPKAKKKGAAAPGQELPPQPPK